ncbi:carbohydrate ABC transporter permease [Deinococcus frigens]|uniref:carbohydrate ABC transporter permease n=1 Tax=Deinococcus frigens TaxID=249403 RepID=UPI0004959A79|nr:sugar ABC transporter permease [Deinococcus frigens]
MQALNPGGRPKGGAARLEATAALYYGPALLFLGLFVFWPLVSTAWISLHDWNMVGANRPWVGLDNYRSLLGDPDFAGTLRQSALYIGLALLGNFLLPLGLALLTLQVGRREAEVYQSLLFLPTVIAVSVGTLIWLWFYLPAGGLFGVALAQFGLRAPNWLSDPAWALPSVALVAVWKFLGFNYLIALAGLRAIPVSVLEAARIDGAGGWPLLRAVILPLFAPSALFLLVSALLAALENVFVPIEVLTVGGPAGATNNLMYAVYQDAFKFFRAGRAAAEAVLLVAAFAVLIVWQFRLLERRTAYDR